jgi:hypothetical protein
MAGLSGRTSNFRGNPKLTMSQENMPKSVRIGVCRIDEFPGKEFTLHVVEPIEPPAPVREFIPIKTPTLSWSATCELVISKADLERLKQLKRLFQKGFPPIDPIALQRATEAIRIAGERITRCMKERQIDKIPVPKAYQRNRFKR